MSDDLAPDDLWGRVAPLPPSRRPSRRYPGRLPVDDRAALRGIVYVLRKGVSWAGTHGTDRLQRGDGLAEPAGMDRDRWPPPARDPPGGTASGGPPGMDDAAVDGSYVRTLKEGAHTGPSPVDRARPGSKHHLITDRNGTPSRCP